MSREVLRRSVGAGALTAVGQIMLAAQFAVAARSTGPGQFGQQVAVASISSVAVALVDSGLSALMIRELAAGRLEARAALGIIRTKRLAVAATSLLLMIATAAVVQSLVLAVLLGLLAWLGWEALTGSVLLKGSLRTVVPARSQVAGRTASLAAFLIADHVLVHSLLVSLCVAWATEALLNWLACGMISGPRSGFTALRKAQVAARGFGLSSLAAMSQQLDTPVVALAAGNLSAGIYAVAGRLIAPLAMTAGILTSTVLPYLARQHTTDKPSNVTDFVIMRLYKYLAIAPLALGIGGLFLIDDVLGSAYAGSAVPLCIIGAGVAVSTWSQGKCAILQTRNLQEPVSLILALGVAVGLVLTYWMSQAWDANGGAAAFLAGQIVIACAVNAISLPRDVLPKR